MKKRKRNLLFVGILLVLALFLISNASAVDVSTTSYSVDSYHLGSAGDDLNTSSYSVRFTTTYQQAGTKSGSTASYTFNSGWFNVSVSVQAEVTGNATINQVFFSNESIFNYSNVFNQSEIVYDMNLNYIGTNCTAQTGSIDNVTFRLFNVEDNVNYINTTAYTFNTTGDLYVLNSSYQIRDSGNWTLFVSCQGSSGSPVTNTTLWEIAWGTIQVNLINPVVDTTVQIYQFFTFSANVTCSGGECDVINVTLDPEEVPVEETPAEEPVPEEIPSNESTELQINETIEEVNITAESGLNETIGNETVEAPSNEISEGIEGNESIEMGANDPIPEENDGIEDGESLSEEDLSNEIEEDIEEGIVDEIDEEVEDEEEMALLEEIEMLENETVMDENIMDGQEYEEGEILETEEGKDLGEKTEDELRYETHFLLMEQTDEQLIVVFYHDYNGTLPIRVEGDVNYSLDKNESEYLENVTLVVELIEGILPRFELHIGEDSEVFTFGKVIPNIELKKGNYTLIDRDDLKLDIRVKFEGNEEIVLRGLENEPNINVTLGTNSQEDVSTSIIAVPSIDIENATIVLEKSEGVNSIISCEDGDFNYESLECSNWQYINVDFIENNRTIEFNIEHFTAYAGGNLTASETAFLTIWDENDVGMPNASINTTDIKLINENVKFFADYELSQNSTDIVNGNCSISFSDISGNMTYNSTFTYFVYERNFTSNGNYPYTVSCISSSYTDLSASDSIVIGTFGNETKGAISTTVGDVPFYTISNNPQTCTLRGGENCVVTWQVNATGILEKIYDFFVEAIGTYVSITNSSHVNIQISANDSTSPVFVSTTATPSVVINGSDVTINANVNDNVQVDSVTANITLPDNSSVFINSLPFVYTTNATQIGIHTVTYFTNDISGNNASITKIFTTALPINLIVNVDVSVDLTANISSTVTANVLVAGTNEILSTTDINGSSALLLPNVPVDISFETSFDNDTSLTLLFNFNLSESVGGSINFGNIRVDPFLLTYGVTTNFSFTGAQVIVSYANVTFTNEDSLQFHKCDNYSVGTGTCISGFNDVTSDTATTHDKNNNRFIHNATSFSGFGIREVIPASEEVSTGVPSKGGGFTPPAPS